MSRRADVYGPYATADEVALALVCACRLVEEDPIAVCEGAHVSVARWYASEALKLAFPLVNRSAIARSVGYRRVGATVDVELMKAVRDHRWRTRYVHDIAGILRKAFPAEDAVAHRQHEDLTAGLMGDPVPGRSALERRGKAP